VEDAWPRRRRPKKTWREIVEKDCQERGLNREEILPSNTIHGILREDAMDRIRWKKQIRDD